ncbi:MAG TPA: DNA repair exonuclease [Methanobacterium subterraneum]|uniref:DNA repair exonuclease n=1 Tax=Methanobacterium subterraneum TaxID=59277 RepID=A0A7J4TGV8_9EURY|nr:DNA repair exonuclease [Methanobacterium subterraneum]
MYKFAHLADCHIGAQKYPELKKLELLAFEECMEKCVEEKVDFIIIAGDLFHSNLPDMRVVKEVVRLLREVNEKGINIYITYGSHDYSPNESSIIDVIAESGLLKKVFIPTVIETDGKEKLKLNFVIDQRTNAKIVGLPGRKIGIEEEYFEKIDRKSLEEETGFKIFVFHSAIKAFIPKYFAEKHKFNIKKSSLPKGFDYYAGGHIHKPILEREGNGFIAFPGPLFAGYPKDLELTANQKWKRGFFIVEVDDNIQKTPVFHEISFKGYISGFRYFKFVADDKNSYQVYEEIKEKVEKEDLDGKIVVIKVKGQLSGGKTSDIDFNEIIRVLKDKGAYHVAINYHGLTSTVFGKSRRKGETPSEIELNLLKENLANLDLPYMNLKGEKLLNVSLELLNVLRRSPKLNEKKSDYTERIVSNALKVIDNGIHK